MLHKHRLEDTERRLREVEARLNGIIAAAVDGLILIDERGVVEVFNPAAERLFGFTTEEVLGNNITLLMPSPYRDQHDGYIGNYLRTGTRKIIGIGREVEGRRKDRSVFPMDLSVGEVQVGGKRLFIGIVRDVTHRKADEESLRLQREQLRLTFNNAPIGSFTCDLEHRFASCNPALCSLVGYTEGELLGQPCTFLCHADDAPQCLAQFQSLISGTQRDFTTDVRYVRKDGGIVLQRWLERNTPFIHRARAASLLAAVEGLLQGGVLTLTHLGRSLSGHSRTKHKIKRGDRLLGNRHLHREREQIYQALAHWLRVGVERPVILVDWSDCEPGHAWLMRTAALSVGGRAIPLYAEVHRLSAYNSPRTHQRFLNALQHVLPDSCHPILITDAGFRGPWFRAVEQLGWDWVGRVRNRIKLQAAGSDRWRYTAAIYRQATRRVCHLGGCWLSHQQPYSAHLYLVKVSRRGRGRPRKARGAGTTARQCRKRYKDPWLLATSLPHEAGMGRRVMRLYAQQMQIEETFGDLKDDRWAFGMALARSQDRARREMLLLIATLATPLLWLVGLAAKARGWMRHFQANTERRRAVLSVIFLGREVFRHPGYPVEYAALIVSLNRLRAQLQIQAFPA